MKTIYNFKKEVCTCTDECLGYLTKSCKRIEEPKKETLEEVAERLSNTTDEFNMFIAGAKWQQEIMYSEEDLEQAHFEGKLKKQSFKLWFEKFKNK